MILQPTNTNTAPFVLNIATHNTRSFTSPHKQQILFNLYNIHKLDIIALQETNFKNTAHLYSLKPIFSDKFISFFNIDLSSQIMGFGVGFFVKNTWPITCFTTPLSITEFIYSIFNLKTK